MMHQRGVGFSKAHSMFQLDGAMEDLGLSSIRRNSLMAAALRSGDLSLFELDPQDFIQRADRILERENLHSGNVGQRRVSPRLLQEDLDEGSLGVNRFGSSFESTPELVTKGSD